MAEFKRGFTGEQQWRCYLCHGEGKMTSGWRYNARVELTPWQMKGSYRYSGSAEWPTFGEPICPVCYLMIARTIDKCYGYSPMSDLWNFFFYVICFRFKFFRRWLRPALLEEVQAQLTSSSGLQE